MSIVEDSPKLPRISICSSKTVFFIVLANKMQRVAVRKAAAPDTVEAQRRLLNSLSRFVRLQCDNACWVVSGEPATIAHYKQQNKHTL